MCSAHGNSIAKSRRVVLYYSQEFCIITAGNVLVGAGKVVVRMEPVWLLVGITAIAGIGGTGLGGAVSCMFRKDSDKTVSLLLSFAAGIMTALAISLSFASGAMLYVVFGELLPESILMWKSKLPAMLAVLGLMTGLIIIYL